MSLPAVSFNRIYIDSIDALTTSTASNSNFTIQLPQPLQGNTSAEVENAVIAYLSNSPSIPYYMANLYFQYTATFDGFTRRYVTTIPTNCFYTLTTLVAAVNTSLATATVIASNAVPSDVGAVDDLSPYISFALNLSTPGTANPNKITFSIDPAYASAFSFVPYGTDRTATDPTGEFIYHSLSYRLGYGMPYDIGSYLNTAEYVAAGGSWAYPSIQRSKYLLLASDFSRQAYSTLGGSKIGRYDVLAKVYVGTANIGDTLVFSSQAVSRYIYTIVPAGSISTIGIQVLDDEGEIWDCPAFGPGTTSISLLLTHRAN